MYMHTYIYTEGYRATPSIALGSSYTLAHELECDSLGG
jgi:hypothetical protein